VRAEMLEVLRTDCIKFARARGLSNRAIHFGHALIFVATHLVVDLLYFAVDPRLRVAPAGGH
jgi:ABC-type dipeptide/oligopeptide/nickel transport system permease component